MIGSPGPDAASNSEAVTAYLLGSLLAAAVGLAWMTARYRHAARGKRPPPQHWGTGKDN